MNDGARDRRTGHSNRPTQDSNYKHADRGYSSSYGNKDYYKQAYRQAYENGYQQGYNAVAAGADTNVFTNEKKPCGELHGFYFWRKQTGGERHADQLLAPVSRRMVN